MKYLSFLLFFVCVFSIELLSQMPSIADSLANTKDSSLVFFNQSSVSKIEAGAITSVVGENDILKLIQLTPGVNTLYENHNEMTVHGFSPGNSSLLVDGVEIYCPTHIYNSMSVFQSDIVSSAKLFSTDYPACYGGRLFSVIDISLKEGDMQKYHSVAEINPVIAKYTIEGPVIKNKLSFIVSGRYNYSSVLGENWESYNDLYLNNFDKFANYKSASFFDVYCKLAYNLNSKNQITYLVSNNSENLESQSDNLTKNINSHIQKLNWKHLFNDRIFLNTSISYSRLSSLIKQTSSYSSEVSNSISDIAYKNEFNYSYTNCNFLKFGLSGILNQFQPLSFKSDIVEVIPDVQKSITTSVFIEDNRLFFDKLLLNYGIRYNAFSTFGKDVVYQYEDDDYLTMNVIGETVYENWELVSFFQSVEPRINAVFQVNQNNTLHFSYSYAKQFLQNLPVSDGLNYTFWYPSTRYLKPQVANHFSVGYKRSFFNGLIDIGANPFYAVMENINEEKEAATFFDDSHLETKIAVGSGKSYGLEFLIKKNSGKFSGWVSYTLSKSELLFENINFNKPYHSPYDRLHNLVVVLFYNVTDNWVLTANYNFVSGTYTTLPQYSFQPVGQVITIYSERNKYQLPNHNRIDISSTFTFKSRTNASKCAIGIGVYNLFDVKYATVTYYNRSTGFIEMSSGGVVPYLKFRYAF